jgi:hypothetical protein
MSSKKILCRGIHCPNRGQCLHNARFLVAPAEKRSSPSVISHCVEGKKFERVALDHPQMRDLDKRNK